MRTVLLGKLNNQTKAEDDIAIDVMLSNAYISCLSTSETSLAALRTLVLNQPDGKWIMAAT